MGSFARNVLINQMKKKNHSNSKQIQHQKKNKNKIASSTSHTKEEHFKLKQI